MRHSQYSVKNYKHFNGHDGQGFDLTLYRDGKRIGTVSDDGWGGEYNYNLDPGEMADLDAYAKALPPYEGFGEPPGYNADMVIGEILEEMDLAKTLDRWSKTKTVFFLPGDDVVKDGYHTLKAPYGEPALKFLADKYAGQGAQVWNPRTKAFDTV